MPEFTGHRDIRSYIRTIWRWKLLILVLVVGAPVVAFVLEHGKPKQYRSSATVALTTGTVTTSSGTGGGYATSNIEAIAQLITTTRVATIAGHVLSPPESAGDAVAGVSASANQVTNFITITAVKDNPRQAADAANAFARALNASQSAQAKATLRAEIRQTRAALKTVAPSSANYPTLQAQLAQYKTQLASQNTVAAVIQGAMPDYTAIGPHPKRAIELGLVIGILLAVAAVMLLDSVDRRLRSPDELEEFTALPLLATIAPSAFDSELDTTPVDAEAFQTLRTSLTYFTIERKIRSVLITSPGEQEGKSTVAVRLALAAASAGLDVVLIDADLRRAGATAKLGLTPTHGLGLVLAEQRPVQSALVEWPLGPDDTGRLRVIGAGSPPPNPAALISSEAMRSLIRTVEDEADLVIVDTPAGLAVSDAVPLMPNVSGIVLVARMNRSSRDTVRRLQKIILSAHGNLLGAVATGVTAGPGYERYSQEYYAPAGEDPKRRRRKAAQKGTLTEVQLVDAQNADTQGEGPGSRPSDSDNSWAASGRKS